MLGSDSYRIKCKCDMDNMNPNFQTKEAKLNWYTTI